MIKLIKNFLNHFKCQHEFVEGKLGVYCKRCGEQIKHECIWEIVDTFSVERYGNLSGKIYLQKCKICGALKHHRVYAKDF